MAEHGAQYPQPNQPWSGPPNYGGGPAPASGPPNYPQQPVSGPHYPQQPMPGPYPPQPISGPIHPVSGPQYPVSGGALVPMGAEQPLCAIGEISVTTTMVHTPVGGCPLRGSQWTAQDQWITSQKTPTWAIVLAILGFCILTIFSLLFLLAKETVLSGVVQVTVTNGPFTYVARIPVYDHGMAQHVHNQVNYARAMAMR
jgi:hypothetical protein